MRKQEEWHLDGNCAKCINWGVCRNDCLAHKERKADQLAARVKKALLMQLARRQSAEQINE